MKKKKKKGKKKILERAGSRAPLKNERGEPSPPPSPPSCPILFPEVGGARRNKKQILE